MAKRLIYLAVGALALTACTSEEVIDDVKTSSNNVIKFKNVVTKPTRADISTETLSHFNVFGFYTMPGNDKNAHQVFYNVDVDKTEEGAWDYETKYGERYWVPGAKYYFYAYSCDNKIISDAMSHGIDYDLNMNDGIDADQRVLEIQNYVCDNKHQHDLVFASNNSGLEGKDYGENVEVSLQFNHLLSKVKAKFTTEFPTEYEIVISDLKIVDICDKGNYDPVSKWHEVGKSDNAEDLILPTYTFDEEGNPIDTEGNPIEVDEEGNPKVEFMIKNSGTEDPMSISTLPVYVIPNNSEVALQFTIDAYIGSDRTQKVLSKTLVGKFTPTWQAGWQYVYNIVINGTTTKMEVIVFKTSVNEFGEETEITDEPEPTEFEVTNNPIKNENVSE